MDDVNPFAAHGSGQPDHTTNGAAEGLHPAKATGAGSELADVERVDPQPGNVPDQPVRGRSVRRRRRPTATRGHRGPSDRAIGWPGPGPTRRPRAAAWSARPQEEDTCAGVDELPSGRGRAGSGPPSSCSTLSLPPPLPPAMSGPSEANSVGNHRSNAVHLPSFEDGTTPWTYTPLFMSQLGLGCARLGSIAAASATIVDPARPRSGRPRDRLVRHRRRYTGGTSESLLGVALRRRHERVQIATKGGFVFADRGPLGRALRLASAPLLARLPRRHSAPAAAPPGPGGGARTKSGFLARPPDRRPRRQPAPPAHRPRRRLPAARLRAIDSRRARERGRSDRRVGGVGDQVRQDRKTGTRSREPRAGVARDSVPTAEALQLPFGLLDPEAGDELIPTAHRDGRHVTVRGVLGAGLLAAPPAPSEPKAARIARIQRLAASSVSRPFSWRSGMSQSAPTSTSPWSERPPAAPARRRRLVRGRPGTREHAQRPLGALSGSEGAS